MTDPNAKILEAMKKNKMFWKFLEFLEFESKNSIEVRSILHHYYYWLYYFIYIC